MIVIEGFLFYGVQRYACGLSVNKAVQNAVFVLSDLAGAFAVRWDLAFVWTEMAMDSFTGDLFVV
jgi:hypothetical protein